MKEFVITISVLLFLAYCVGGFMVGLVTSDGRDFYYKNYNLRKFAADLLCGPLYWVMLLFISLGNLIEWLRRSN